MCDPNHRATSRAVAEPGRSPSGWSRRLGAITTLGQDRSPGAPPPGLNLGPENTGAAARKLEAGRIVDEPPVRTFRLSAWPGAGAEGPNPFYTNSAQMATHWALALICLVWKTPTEPVVSALHAVGSPGGCVGLGGTM